VDGLAYCLVSLEEDNTPTLISCRQIIAGVVKLDCGYDIGYKRGGKLAKLGRIVEDSIRSGELMLLMPLAFCDVLYITLITKASVIN